ncbi:hypothetical protein [Pseudomonas amygdali]|uniref:hypothetical protein n=1 Tax=Pseudomonas amygdali TaxID=47877 RepID=UPI0006CDCDC3|nr:hypothetical protein [Pseudomonas amygdali]KPB36758.1 Uncharacterized protein AC516_1383 [Pseudomonas amygdali pv. sesami]
MTVDIEKLEALAKAAEAGGAEWSDLDINTERMYPAEGALVDLYEFATPSVLLEVIASGKRMAARLLCCTMCGGQGEVYSGRTSYEGYNQPPEPIMDKCGECDGAGVLGDGQECLSILDELEQVKAENAGLKTGYEAYERVNAELTQRIANLELCQTASLGVSGIIKSAASELGFDAASEDSALDYLIGLARKAGALRADCEALRKDASLHSNLQRAAGELPGAWSIGLFVERHAGWVSLLDGDGCEFELSGEGHLGEQVSEALEVALEMSKEAAQ